MPFDGLDEKNGFKSSLVTAHTKSKAFEYARDAAVILVPKVIEMLKPTHVLFFTGPNYDWVLNAIFKPGGVTEEVPPKGGFTTPGYRGGEPVQTIRSVKIQGFNGTALRTYHPAHYNRKGCLPQFIDYLKSVL